GVRSADSRIGQRAPDAIDGVIMQFLELPGCAAPVTDVRLVPDFPIPGLDFSPPVLFQAMLRPGKRQVPPLGVISRWVSPAGENFVVSRPRRPMMLVRFRFARERLGHETDLDVGTDAVLQVGVENAVEDGPVIDRFALGVFVIYAGRTPFQSRGAVTG